jgi:hypothetical protein
MTQYTSSDFRDRGSKGDLSKGTERELEGRHKHQCMSCVGIHGYLSRSDLNVLRYRYVISIRLECRYRSITAERCLQASVTVPGIHVGVAQWLRYQ